MRAILGDSVLHQLEQKSATVPRYALGDVRRSYSATAHLYRNQQWGKKSRDSLRQPSVPTPAAIRKELVYLVDPLKLANHVLKLLQDKKFEEAHLLVQTASKSSPCVVSWNHIINSQMMEGKVNAAITLYNEVCRSFFSTSTMICRY
jgi:pentatricopeptide repeat protein